jgi:hypothetical protein
MSPLNTAGTPRRARSAANAGAVSPHFGPRFGPCFEAREARARVAIVFWSSMANPAMVKENKLGEEAEVAQKA